MDAHILAIFPIYRLSSIRLFLDIMFSLQMNAGIVSSKIFSGRDSISEYATIAFFQVLTSSLFAITFPPLSIYTSDAQ
jgi:hypothetical protein